MIEKLNETSFLSNDKKHSWGQFWALNYNSVDLL